MEQIKQKTLIRRGVRMCVDIFLFCPRDQHSRRRVPGDATRLARTGAQKLARKTPRARIRLVGALIQDQHCVSCRSTDNPRCTLRVARQAINRARNSTPQARHAAQRNVILERYSET
jgi:hypothetical protein